MSNEPDWRPRCDLSILSARADLLRRVRAFMERRGIREVETPILDVSGNTDPNIESVRATVRLGGARPRQYYLHTSPEFPMKRLLAAGAGPIYQIVRVFRDDPIGRLHQPEFTMLEWYRPGLDHHDLMSELEELLREMGLPSTRRLAYGAAFITHCGLDPHTAGLEELQAAASERGLASSEDDRSVLLDFLFSHAVAPRLGEAPVFIYDYPACQAALARIREGDPPIAQRFELFIDRMEIANGYNELTDYIKQDSRFFQDNERRARRGLETIPADKKLIAALRHGLPECAGVAVGLDRLLMVMRGAKRIDDVLTFPHSGPG